MGWGGWGCRGDAPGSALGGIYTIRWRSDGGFGWVLSAANTTPVRQLFMLKQLTEILRMKDDKSQIHMKKINNKNSRPRPQPNFLEMIPEHCSCDCLPPRCHCLRRRRVSPCRPRSAELAYGSKCLHLDWEGRKAWLYGCPSQTALWPARYRAVG